MNIPASQKVCEAIPRAIAARRRALEAVKEEKELLENWIKSRDGEDAVFWMLSQDTIDDTEREACEAEAELIAAIRESAKEPKAVAL